MDSISFDTLAYSRKLQSCGVPQEQANGMAEAQKEAFDQLVDARQLASKQDIARLEKLVIETVATSERHITNMFLSLGAILIAALGVAVAVIISRSVPL